MTSRRHYDHFKLQRESKTRESEAGGSLKNTSGLQEDPFAKEVGL